MALTRSKKEELLQQYGEGIAQSQVLIWGINNGLSVAQTEELRSRLREVGASTLVVKNTLFRMAVENAELPYSAEMMQGPCLVTFAGEDLAGAAKAVTDFAKANDDEFAVQCGIVSGALVGPEQITALASLPSREVLLAQVLGGLQAPVTGFVSVLAGVMRGFVTVLDGRREQLESAAS